MSGLACDVPTVVSMGGGCSGILSTVVPSQVHHDNSRHFRGNYQRVSLNNQFPSAPGAFLTRKGKKEGDRLCAGLGTILSWGAVQPPVPSNFTKLNIFSLGELRQTMV